MNLDEWEEKTDQSFKWVENYALIGDWDGVQGYQTLVIPERDSIGSSGFWYTVLYFTGMDYGGGYAGHAVIGESELHGLLEQCDGDARAFYDKVKDIT